MAKTVQPIAIELGIKGGEKLAALNRSFRDLSKQIKLSDVDIIQATKDVAKFAQEAGDSEATIRGQIKAFEGLREQAAMGGKAYVQLGSDIEGLKATLRGSTNEMEQQRAAFVKTGSSARASASDIAGVVSQLENLRKKARPGSSAFAQLGKDIAALKSQLREANIEVKKFNAGFEISQRPAMNLEKIQRQVGRLAEGLKTLNFISDDFLNTQERIALLGQVQSRTVGRQQVRAAEQLFSSKAFENFVGGPAGKLDLPRTAAALNLEISELQEQLANTVPGSKYAELTVEIASKQKELNKILDVTADAYDRVAAAQDRSARVAEKISGIQEYQRSTGGIAAGVGGFRDPDTGAIIARGTGSVRDRRAFRAARAELANSIIDGAVQQARALALPAAGETTAPGTGAAISGGAVPLRGTRGPLRPIAELPTDLGTIGGRRQRPAGVEAEINDQARRSYISQTEAVRKNNEAKEQAIKIEQGYKAEIDKAAKANNQSINSTTRLRSALDAYRSTLPTTSKEFRNLTDQINKLDKQSEKTSRRMRGRRMSAGQLAQAAGATVSGGIFGGPEGFLGGAIGTVFGGPGGAFAGAALGAQVGQFRQQIGQYSEMAAEVDRLRLGLAGASNDFQDFVAAVQATEGASKRLLIPLSDSYRIMTQLKANTVELGISTEDTRKIFEGITASIYKTGGGLAEVEGAMRAVIQVLSKGSPQAEELRGQLGERLPAAIVDFAKFTERTPEELADAFQKSEVTLDEFVDFAKNKFDENGQYLDELASNAAYAGLRYEKAIERIQLTTGRAFQATGSRLQDFAAKWINRIDAIINKAQEIGVIEKGPSFYVEEVLSGGMTIEELEDEVLRLSLVAKKAREANFNSGVVQNTQRDVDAAEQALIRLRASEKLTKERKEQLKAQEAQLKLENQSKSFLSAVEQRENAIAQARIQLEERAAQIREQAVQRAKQLEEGFAQQRLNNERQIQDLRLQLSYVEEDIAFGAAEARAIAGGANPETFRVRKEIIDLARQQKEEEISLERQLLDEQTENTKAIEQFKIDNAKAINQANEDYAKQIGNIQQQYARSVAKIVEEGTGKAGKRLEISGKIVAEFIKQGQASATLSQYGVYMDDADMPRKLPGTVLDTQAFEAVKGQINLYDLAAKKIKEYTKELTDLPTAAAITAPAIDSIGVNISDLTARLNANKSALEATRQRIRGLSKDLSDAERIEKVNAILREQAAPVSGALRGAQTQLAEQRGVLRLGQEGYSESTARQLFAQETAAAIALENLEAAREEANKQGIPVDEAEYAKIAEGIRKATEETRALTLALENLSTGDKLRTGIIELRDELKTLVDPANQIKGAATAIGTAFADSFTSVISGSATTQEALANFFGNIGKYFLDMAAQIIQKMITMAILNQVVGLLPGLGSSASNFNLNGFGNLGSDAGSGVSGFLAGASGILGKANGGPVNANQPYIVGERGPELFVPFQQGTVVSNEALQQGTVVSNEALQQAATTQVPFTRNAESVTQAQETAQAMRAAGPIEVRYESNVINGVEYVTAEQHRKGMAQAAERGRSLTIQALQNSVKTRGRVGL